MMLDFVSQRYGVLPSQLIAEGSSIDVLVADVAQSYTNEKAEEARAQAEGKNYIKPAAKLSEKQMLDMMQRVRNQNAN